MIPRLDISFPFQRQWQYWFGREYTPTKGEFLLNHARSGIYITLKTALPNGGKVGVMAYNCDTVMNPVLQAGCEVVFLDVDDDLRLQVTGDRLQDLDAIVVTNIFGIKNDVAAIRKVCPKALIIEDNAHGYGLEEDGDVIIYSINQGKYPALGPGGILKVKKESLKDKIEAEYDKLPKVGIISQIKFFISMLLMAIMYHPWIYGWLTKPIKDRKSPKSGAPEPMYITKMCPGVSRMYKAWLQDHSNHPSPSEDGQGVKLFMDIIHTDNPKRVIAEYRTKGIEAETHFKHWPMWAAHYGYVQGSCPIAERLIHELVMVPNYYKK